MIRFLSRHTFPVLTACTHASSFSIHLKSAPSATVASFQDALPCSGQSWVGSRVVQPPVAQALPGAALPKTQNICTYPSPGTFPFA